MDRLGVDLDFVFIYMDDILVASRDEATQMAHLRLHMERMREFKLVLNLQKCQFSCQAVDFLGHRILERGAESCGHDSGFQVAS